MNTASAQKGSVLLPVKTAEKGGGKTKAAAAGTTVRAPGKKDFRDILRHTLRESDKQERSEAALLRGHRTAPSKNQDNAAPVIRSQPDQGLAVRDETDSKTGKESAAAAAGILVPRDGLDKNNRRETVPHRSKAETPVLAANAPRPEARTRETRNVEQQTKVTLVDRRQPSKEKVAADARAETPAAVHQSAQQARPDNEPQGENRQLSVRLEGPATGSVRVAEAPPSRSASVPAPFYNQLHGEFVDRAKIIMKDGGGELRLTLKPQHLGSLRLSVTLEERVLKGHIVVDNESVRTIVEGQLDSLLRSFREGGFDPLQLTVSVAGEDGGQKQQERQRHQPPTAVAMTIEQEEESVENAHIRLEA